MIRTIPTQESLTVEFKSDLSRLPDRELIKTADYVRQAGFDSIQQEQMVNNYVKNHGKITRQETMDLCRIGKDQATRLLRRLIDGNKLKLVGQGRGAYYEFP